MVSVNSIIRKTTDKIDDLIICAPLSKLKDVTERISQVIGMAKRTYYSVSGHQ